jgi:TM2 domain-containing membrane protein YozV
MFQGAQPQPTIIIQQQGVEQTPYDPSWPIKSKIVVGILAILLGGIGVHKFYMGKIGMGILYIVFCWTGIPSLIGIIEGIMYLVSSDHNFQVKYHVRLQ